METEIVKHISFENKVKITETQVGAVISYPTSKKLYVVATLDNEGRKNESRLLFSFTQYYNSRIKNFDVKQHISGTGILIEPGKDEKFEKQYKELIEGEFKFEKNKPYEKLFKKLITKYPDLTQNE